LHYFDVGSAKHQDVITGRFQRLLLYRASLSRAEIRKFTNYSYLLYVAKEAMHARDGCARVILKDGGEVWLDACKGIVYDPGRDPA
jgi:hypothetical protein